MSGQRRIAEIEEHQVSTGETLASVATANGLTWQQLAVFNWGTSDPNQINRHLHDDVGCRKKTPDGRNYVFDSTDKPGKIFVPKQWRLDGLATDQTHTIRVRRLKFDRADSVIRLFDWQGKAMAGTPYAIEVGGREVSRGSADGDGDARIPDVLAERCIVRWGVPAAPAPVRGESTEGQDAESASAAASREFAFEREIFLNVEGSAPAPADDEASRKRLHNMGYVLGSTLAENVRAYQRDIGAALTGLLRDIQSHVEDCHDEQCKPPGEKGTK